MATSQIPTDVPTVLTITPNPLVASSQASSHRSVSAIEQQLTKLPHLDADRRFERNHRKLEMQDARQAMSAAEALGKMPADGEAIHIVISGRFALWDFTPAILNLSGSSIDTLHVATLGFSKRNIAKMCEMLDTGKIGTVHLLCSHYFAGTSGPIYNFAVQEFASRPAAKFLSVRTHAKMILIALADGRRLVIESSANLRSCKNIEQASVFADAALHAFHKCWIESLFAEAGL
jgi:hypothetical protein